MRRMWLGGLGIVEVVLINMEIVRRLEYRL